MQRSWTPARTFPSAPAGKPIDPDRTWSPRGPGAPVRSGTTAAPACGAARHRTPRDRSAASLGGANAPLPWQPARAHALTDQAQRSLEDPLRRRFPTTAGQRRARTTRPPAARLWIRSPRHRCRPDPQLDRSLRRIFVEDFFPDDGGRARCHDARKRADAGQQAGPHETFDQWTLLHHSGFNQMRESLPIAVADSTARCVPRRRGINHPRGRGINHPGRGGSTIQAAVDQPSRPPQIISTISAFTRSNSSAGTGKPLKIHCVRTCSISP